MLYTIQTFLEDFFENRNYLVNDTYLVNLAKLYYRERLDHLDEEFLNKLHSISTTFYDNNDVGERKKFEKVLLDRLDRKFKKNY